MFEKLFDRPFALARHRNAPMLDERLQFLRHKADLGWARDTLRAAANDMLAIGAELNLPERADEQISRDEVEKVAKRRWRKRARSSSGREASPNAHRRFQTNAVHWLRFLGRLYEPPVSRPQYADIVDSFTEYLARERGLSPQTISSQRWNAGDFLSRLESAGLTLSELTINSIDDMLMAKITEASYSRVSTRTYASQLRSFLRYAEMRDLCQQGLAENVRAARVFPHERLPSGPCWGDVQRVLATADDEHPTNVRDRAILLLFAVYGLRSGEVVRLRLDDFDWERELLSVRRSKSHDAHVYPLSRTVGDAVLRYVTDVRPRSIHREVFLTRGAPYRPLSAGLWRIVASRLRPLGIPLAHHGPHALRHACATYLLTQGFSFKEIGDHLGHRDPEATRIYAKVDIVGLRRVAEFDLGELGEML